MVFVQIQAEDQSTGRAETSQKVKTGPKGRDVTARQPHTRVIAYRRESGWSLLN